MMVRGMVWKNEVKFVHFKVTSRLFLVSLVGKHLM